MKRIGQGLQFNVFDRGEQVEKVPTTPAEIRNRLLRANPMWLLRPAALRRKVQQVVAEREEAVQQFRAHPTDRTLFANLQVEHGNISQDKVQPLGKALKAGTDGYALIDRYVEFQLQCWSQGFAETSFNFTVNNGLDCTGKLVVLDIGEVTFDKAGIRREIERRLWERAWSAWHDLPAELRAYFFYKMNKAMTLENLEMYWKETPVARILPLRSAEQFNLYAQAPAPVRKEPARIFSLA
jgi:hypothetical protein